MCSPSTALKVNCLVIRHLYFRSVRGDLQEGHGCASRYQFPFFLVPIPVSRARKRDFCALLPSRTPIFGYFEHKIEVFVRFWLPGPPFSGISSTKSGFLCAFGVWNPHFRAFRAQNRGFCALFAFGTLIFGHFEHKIGVFVRFEISMTQEEDPRENVIAERVNGILLY